MKCVLFPCNESIAHGIANPLFPQQYKRMLITYTNMPELFECIKLGNYHYRCPAVNPSLCHCGRKNKNSSLFKLEKK